MAQPIFQLKIEGAQELEKALLSLPAALGIRTLQRALTLAAIPIAEDAQGRIERYSSRLPAGIRVLTQLSRRQRRQYAKRKGDAYVFLGATAAGRGLAHLFEFGTAPRYHKSGKFTGRMQARPFLRPAWEAGKRGALEAFTAILWKEIEKAAKRLSRRQAKQRSMVK